MDQRMIYTVLYFGSPTPEKTLCTITKAINEEIEKGWKPQGGISTLFAGGVLQHHKR